MNRPARLLVAVAAAGLTLTGCATGLTSGDRAASPASVQSADDGGSVVRIPPSPSGGSPSPESATPGGVPAPGLSVGPDGVSAPGLSVGPDGVSVPGLSVGPDGVAVDGGTTAQADAGAPFVQRACGEGENVVIDLDGSSFTLTGACASITITADGAFADAESAGAVVVSGHDSSLTAVEVTSLEVSGGSNFVDTGQARDVVISGSDNSVTLAAHSTIAVSGNDNYVAFDSTTGAAPTDTGSSNTITG